MKYKLTLIISALWCLSLNAQYQVEFILKEQTTIKHDSIFIVGSFNGWDSLSNTKYLMESLNNGNKAITLTLGPGIIEYKFHRGSWLTVEKRYSGGEVENRVVDIYQDTTFIDSVQAWRDLMHIDKKAALAQESSDVGKVRLQAALARSYAFQPEFYNIDSAFFFAQKAIDLQQRILQSGDYDLDENPDYYNQLISIKEIVASLLHALGNYPKSLEIRLENFEIAEQIQDKSAMIYAINNIADDYMSMKDFKSVLSYTKLGESLINVEDVADQEDQWPPLVLFHKMSEAYYYLDRLDSAQFYANKLKMLLTENVYPYLKIWNELQLGDILAAKGEHQAAYSAYRQLIRNASSLHATTIIARSHIGMAKIFQEENQTDSALYYAREALNYFQNNEIEVQSWGENSNRFIAEVSPIIAELYQSKEQLDSAYKYLNLSVTLKDDLYNTDKVRQFQTLSFNEAARRQELEQQAIQAKKEFQTKVKIYGLVGLLASIMFLTLILYSNNRRKQKLNATLQRQKQEIESTLAELKNTQSQLIHSEKMASLGELTAGIAHEIQNPLNFVNNFSEINVELTKELEEEIQNGDIEEVKTLSKDIRENEEKIMYHGKRAESIVKGMLQHSRSNSGEKLPTDINALADEYLRLAYHGYRAKDKSFNAQFETDFDESLEKMMVVPQDIGRVLLNLISNAFHAVRERSMQIETKEDYEPVVIVKTQKQNNNVLIEIADNGPGMSDKIKNKIFQPFFTTKPAGEGTGLGLSMSFDIIKLHNGKITVDTEEGQGTTFKIILPITNTK